MTNNGFSLRDFMESSPFPAYLESCWNGKYYLNFPRERQIDAFDPGGVIAHSLFYHIYTERLKLKTAVPGRAAQLAAWLAAQVREDGYTNTPDGFSTHPAFNSTVADALGSAAWYAADLGMDAAIREQVIAALLRIFEHNPRIRYPEGAQGKTQQLRFELRVYYWVWLLTGEEKYRRQFFEAFDKGVHAYTHQVAVDGPILQPSMNPDWTWNYVCTGGITREHATNTHTPAYYCTEANGFLFVYLHGLRNGTISRNENYDCFCRNYIKGLIRNLSRAGHLASDLDGYGIHRAWFAPVLIEGIPLEAAEAAKVLGLDQEWSAWLRWYIESYVDFVRRNPSYPESGLPGALPYGHKIGIEAQFSQLAGTRFYGSLARALSEFENLDYLVAAPVPSYASYAWKAQWLRVSTAAYETSFAGYTCLRNIPVVPCYGDPHLGTLIGGSPVTTLQSGSELMYAAAFPIPALWHMEVLDHNGRLLQSCATAPDDEISMTVRHSAGNMLNDQSFDPYAEPCNLIIADGEYVESSWTRCERKFNLRFYVNNRYDTDGYDIDWGMSGKAGHYYDRVSFCIPVPELNAEYRISDGPWQPLVAGTAEALPTALRWQVGGRWCQVDLNGLTGADDGAKSCCSVSLLPDTDGMPGGKNSFCPYRLYQIRIEIVPSVRSAVWRLRHRISFYS